MYKHTLLTTSLVFLTLFTASCGTSPNANLYILNAMDRGGALSNLALEGQSVTVKVGPVSVPDTLDQSLIVSRSGANRLITDEFNRWGGDFQSDILGIIGENISILLPTDQVILSQEIALLPIDFQVLVNIREFDGVLGGVVTLNADWTVAAKGKEKTIVTKKSVLKDNAEGESYQAYVAAQSRLLEKLSQQITVEIRKQLLK